MIKKLENGNTLITLGEGTIFTGNVHSENEDKPFGIYFSNEKGKSEDAVIIHISGESGVASYLMALIRFLEAHAGSEIDKFNETVKQLKQDLEPLLPKSKNE